MYKKLFSAIIMALMMVSLSLSSCGSDEPDNPYDPSGSIGNQDEPNSSKTNYNTLIAKHVKVTQYFEDYCWYFTIKSTLEKACPNVNISYKISHGCKNNADRSFCLSSNNDSNYYTKSYKSGDYIVTEYRFPFYFYYVAMYQLYSGNYMDDVATYQLYMNSYFALKDQSKLSEDERDLLNSIKNTYNKVLPEVKANWKTWLWVEIDGKAYPPLPSYTL